jgi:hypothetical protein
MGTQNQKLHITLSKEIYEMLLADAKQRFGNRKGALSLNVERILREHFNMEEKA